MNGILNKISSIVWGPQLLVLILGCGVYLTVATRFVQIRLFPRALRTFLQEIKRKDEDTGVSGFQALCTALSATVGTGNIAGVAGAIALGGPGAIFWMWVFAFFGMALKFTEAALAVRYRVKDGNEFRGGPMYMIEKGLGIRWRWMAMVYSFFGVVAAFGVGNATQINTAITGINNVMEGVGLPSTTADNLLIGVVFAVIIWVSVSGGARRIGKVAQGLIPFACLSYIILCCLAIALRFSALRGAITSIFIGAFEPKSVTAGVLGSAFIALRVGASRGLFTNEAGMGTAAMAHGTAEVREPVQQGLMGIVEVFLDTIVICTLTALVILTSGVSVPYGDDPGLNLTVLAFSSVFGGWISSVIAVFLCVFALATVLGWGLYGSVCAEYLMGKRAHKWMLRTQMLVIIFSSVTGTQTVWLLSEAVNGLMAFPNLIALILLSPHLVSLTAKRIPLRKARKGGTAT